MKLKEEKQIEKKGERGRLEKERRRKERKEGI
jgi:hypothetical protein